MKTVNGNLDSARRCVEHIARKFHSEGYVVKQGQEYGCFVLSIRSATNGILGHLKRFTAIAKDVTLRIGSNGARLTVEANGEYTRQLATGGFGTFVAVGAVAITAVAGAFSQHALANRIEADAISFLENEDSRSSPHV